MPVGGGGRAVMLSPSLLATLALALLAADASRAQPRPAALAEPPKADTAVEVVKEVGLASVYAADLEGRLTARGEPYDGNRLTAAHRTLPLGTWVRVLDPSTGRSVQVVINDRWGGGPGRVINLSRRAAEELGLGTYGERLVHLRVETVGDGRRGTPAADAAVAVDAAAVRERLPDRIEETRDDPSARARRCQNEADILGLRDEWRERHVAGCLQRAAQRKGR